MRNLPLGKIRYSSESIKLGANCRTVLHFFKTFLHRLAGCTPNAKIAVNSCVDRGLGESLSKTGNRQVVHRAAQLRMNDVDTGTNKMDFCWRRRGIPLRPTPQRTRAR